MPKYTIDGTTLSDVADAVRELDGNPDTMTPAQMASRIRAVQPGGADLSVIADDYDTTATYDVGDYCIHEGGLYVCTTAISTAEAWTAGHWEEVTVGDELSDLKSDLNDLEETISGLDEAYDFVKDNDFDGNILQDNVIQSPYAIDEVLDSSLIMSNGSISTGDSYSTQFVSPLIPIESGKYGLKVVHSSTIPAMGNIHNGNNYKNGYTFVAADGETIVARPSLMQNVGTDIYVFEVPSSAAYVRFCVLKNNSSSEYTANALRFFNQWILLPNADETITEDFFDIGDPKPNDTISKILRSDGSYREITDEKARNAIANMNVDGMTAFMKLNGFESEITNLLGLPYADNDILKFASILSSGAIRNTKSNLDRNFSITPLIPVETGTYILYVPSGSGTATRGQLSPTNGGYGLFASDGTTAVSKTSMTDLGNGIFSIVVTEGASYIRFVFYHGPNNSNVFSEENVAIGLYYVNKNWMFIKSDSESVTPSDLTRKPDKGIDRIIRADGSILAFTQSELSDKKILVFGDSIWGNDRQCGICDYLADYSGATIYNCAIGGTRITGDRSAQPNWQAFDGANLITAKLTDTWTNQDTYAADVVYYVATETLPLLKSIDLSSIDVIILAYGHNDFTSDHTLESITSAYTSVIDALLTSYPKIRILVCTSPWRMFSGTDGDSFTNENGDTLKDMDDAIVAMAKSKHVPVLNTLEEVPWCALTAGVYLDSDSVHPNYEGNNVYAHVVNGKLRSMF